MDFFQSQDRAKQRTNLLVTLYSIAVVLLILAIYFIIVAIFRPEPKPYEILTFKERWWEPATFIYVTLGTLLIVGLGSAYRIKTLSGGGGEVAKMLGGRKISNNTDDLNEKKILNVVEEMALASGIPVPPVYLLDNEPTINAFAAGFSPESAVIGVTIGAISKLSRDELQGVIAHEFSHIFNGDMRLNIRLIGVLHGILVIALLGYWMMRIFRPSGSSKNNNGALLALLGLALMVIGYVGVLIAKIIKSAVSRQREYLADASAVQFTRNPAGIAGALKKIGMYKTILQSSHKEEASHLFFSNALSFSFLGLFATHPPLEERIRRLDPSFDLGEKTGASQITGTMSDSVSGFATGPAVGPESVVSSIGSPSLMHLKMASALLADLPEHLNKSAREVKSAQWVVYALLLSDEPEIRHSQLHMVAASATGSVSEEVARLYPIVSSLDERLRLPLVEIAVSTLRNMEKAEYDLFKGLVEELVQADKEVDLFEYMLNRMIVRTLAANFGELPPYKEHYTHILDVSAEAVKVVSCLARWGSESEEEARIVFKKGIDVLDLSVSEAEISFDECSLDMLDNSLSELAMSSMKLKKKIVDACVVCVLGDGQMTVDESHTLRAIGDYLGCPIPPLVTGMND